MCAQIYVRTQFVGRGIKGEQIYMRSAKVSRWAQQHLQIYTVFGVAATKIYGCLQTQEALRAEIVYDHIYARHLELTLQFLY